MCVSTSRQADKAWLRPGKPPHMHLPITLQARLGWN